MLRPISTARGFTLIELVVAMAIVGIIAVLAMQSFSAMTQNARISAAAKSYLVGLQMARTEAIRLNQPVEFVMTDALPASAVRATPTPNGLSWVVGYQDLAASSVYHVVEAKSKSEGSGQAGGSSLQVVGSGAGFTGAVTFDGLGVAALAPITMAISNPAGGACATTSVPAPMRCQRINVSAGGQLSVCDPAAAIGDSRACP